MNSEKSQISEKEIRILFNKGMRNIVQDKFTEAVEIFEQVVEKSPRIQTAWYNLGISHQYLGNYHRAIDMYKIALDIEPKFPEALYCLGIAYNKIGKRREAMSSINNAREINPAITGEIPDDIHFSFMRLPEDLHAFEGRETTSYQLVDGTTEGATPEYCTNCGQKQWKRLTENSLLKLICLLYGYEIIVGRTRRSTVPSATQDHWSGSQDDNEKTLEKDYEKGRR
jgi:tetratricopeptide (TPR) repeat protein